MRHALCAILWITAFSPPAFVQPFDKARFRQAIEMPAINIPFGVNFRSNERDGRGNKFEPAQKLALEQKKLSGGPADADVYLELRALYLECEKDDKKAKEMMTKAEALLRPYVQTTDAKQAYLLTLYGTVLEALTDNPWADCEKLARRAVALAPQDWRCWAYLAHVRHQQIPAILCGGDDKHLAKERRTQEVLGMLYLQRFNPQHVNDAEKALNEALQFHDKARELAPNEPKRQVQRYGFRLTEIVLRNGVNAARGHKPAYPMQQLERVLLDELEATAKLHPDHLLWQSQTAHQLILLGWQTEGKGAKAFRPARPQDHAAIQAALRNIEKLADEGQGETAVFCHSMLTALYSSMQDHASVEKYARKILQIDAKYAPAWEQLQQALMLQNRHDEAVQTARTLVQHLPGARSYYLLSKAHALQGRYDLAEQSCREGLKANPTDIHCLLGMAAAILRKGDDAQHLRDAQTLLDLVRRECRPDAAPALFVELEYLTLAHQALAGEHEIARVRLQRMHADHPEQARYGKLLACLVP
jgi:tetratricopeptide (TPR) repeat protein